MNDIDWTLVRELRATSDRMERAAFTMQESVHRLEFLLADGYGGNGARLIELLESYHLQVEGLLKERNAYKEALENIRDEDILKEDMIDISVNVLNKSVLARNRGSALASVDINAMVDRFLGWHLPVDFSPDCGISFTPLGHPNGHPTGTNLFSAAQAREMIEHLLVAGGPSPICPGCGMMMTFKDGKWVRSIFDDVDK